MYLMLNLTLFSLSFSSFSQSPFFAISTLGSSSSQALHFHKLQLIKNFSPFLNIQDSRFKSIVHFSESQFINFLSNALIIDSKSSNKNNNNYNSILFNSSLSLADQENTENLMFSVANCVFQQIKSKKEGSAIYFHNQNGKLIISSAGFTLCYSFLNGGAIFFKGSTLNISQSCFLGCVSQSNGQSMAVELSDDGSGLYEYLSVSQCSPKRHLGNSQCIFVSHGIQNFANINNSANHVVEFGSCLCSAFTSSMTLHFSNFIGNSGKNGFWFYKTSIEDSFSYCNIIENVVSQDDRSLLTLEQAGLTVFGFVFVGNMCQTYFSGGIELQLNECRFDSAQTDNVFKKCQKIDIGNSKFSVTNLTARAMPIQNTWGCWAYGYPSPTPSRSMPPIEAAADNAAEGFTVFLVLMMVASITSSVVYHIYSTQLLNTKKRNLESLQIG